jgi:hypothetical protein
MPPRGDRRPRVSGAEGLVIRASCPGSLRSEEVEWRDEGEILELILCRLRELERAGCDRAECALLAGRLDVDLARAIDLLGRGCPPDLAVQILV